MNNIFNIRQDILEMSDRVEEELQPIFKELDDNCLNNSSKVLKVFQKYNVGTNDFAEITGYGYSDPGRDKLEAMYSEIFGAEDAIVRPQIMSTGDSSNSLIAHGVKYEEIPLINDEFDYEAIKTRISKKDVKLVEIQRSRGYSHRSAIVIERIEKAIKIVKEADPNCIVLVDNCYGEFTEDREPTEVGADITISSLMKNLGAGIATSGGYVVGKKEYIHLIAEELTAPTIGKDLGANFNVLLTYFKGLFMAPKAVNATLKSMIYASKMLENFGFEAFPKYNEKRADIVQTVELKTRDNLIKFCQGIQEGSPIESYVVPIPDQTPGYPNEEIMAGGSFTPGSTIELSCDGPLVEPFTAYMQGGLTYEYGKLGVLIALNKMLNDN